MAHKSWRETTSEMILKIPLIWFTSAGIRLALAVIFMPVIAYLLYPSIVDAALQIAGNTP